MFHLMIIAVEEKEGVLIMCDIAPFQMKCVNEEHKDELMSCAVHHLYQAFNEIWLQAPIIKHFVEPYCCPDFELKRSE